MDWLESSRIEIVGSYLNEAFSSVSSVEDFSPAVWRALSGGRLANRGIGRFSFGDHVTPSDFLSREKTRNFPGFG